MIVWQRRLYQIFARNIKESSHQISHELSHETSRKQFHFRLISFGLASYRRNMAKRERKEFDNQCMIVMTLKKVFCVNESDEKI